MARLDVHGGIMLGAEGTLPEDGVKGTLWIDLDRQDPRVGTWLEEESGLDRSVLDALLAEDTRAWLLQQGDGFAAILFGVNLNPGAEPDDMVTVRLWCDARRVITLHHRGVRAIEDLREQIKSRKGPATPGEFVFRLAQRLASRVHPVLEDLDAQIDDLDEALSDHAIHKVKLHLPDLRRQIVHLRRHLHPQRDVLEHLMTMESALLPQRHRHALHETTNRLVRDLELLDALRERLHVTQDEYIASLQQRLASRMYVLSLVAAIVLPLSLLTSLLGVNLAGIPGAEHPAAFARLVALLVGVAIIQYILFRRLKWL